MDLFIDMSVVILYFAIVLIAGYLVSRRHKTDTADEFLTGGRTLSWPKVGLTLLAMSIDSGIMAYAGIGFVWGLAIQWNAVNLWITAPFAAMFLIPIYWRTNVVTTTELLEKRFSVASRVLFASVMIITFIVMLTTLAYLGALLLNELFNWPLELGVLVLFIISGIYVTLGGMKTVLTINMYQAGFMVLAILAVSGMALYHVGGLVGFMEITSLSKAGTLMTSTLPVIDFNLFSEAWYPIPAGIIWAIIAGSAWISCNFSMVQRLLSSKNEEHAQKAMLFLGVTHIVLFLAGYIVGVSMHSIMPDVMPDKAYITVLLDMFPVGVRGLLIAGLLASLLSTIDGILTATSTMGTKDIYLRFINSNSSDKKTKNIARSIQVLAIISVFIVLPFAAESVTVMSFVQSFIGDVFGVIIAIFLVAVFSKRATPNAAFIGGLTGIAVGVILDNATALSFPNVGISTFLYTIISILILSRFEKPMTDEQLENLTVHTIKGVKGPFIGLAAWPNLWKVILIIQVSWIGLTVLWEILIRL